VNPGENLGYVSWNHHSLGHIWGLSRKQTIKRRSSTICHFLFLRLQPGELLDLDAMGYSPLLDEAL
jgi:hypothetical protein